MGRLWSALVSMRTTAILLVAFSVLLLLNVALPQRATDPEAYALALRKGPAARFVLETLGLGDVATSPVFLATLALLFLSLAAVLVARLAGTVRRMRFAPPTPAQLEALFSADPIRAAAGAPPPPGRLVALLAEQGYRAVPVGEGVVWGLKHRFALLGFPLFHASFFLLLAGGLQLFLTRDVTKLVGGEGQPLDTRAGAVTRRAPLGPPPPAQLTISRVDVRLVDGQPVELAASLVLDGAPRALTRINHPARFGALTVLVDRAGLAPVLWLVDRDGFTLDRVIVPTAVLGGDLPTRLPIGPQGDVEVVLPPVRMGKAFPEREALATAAVPLRVNVGGRQIFEGAVRPGEPIAVGDRVLQVQEIRYWAGLLLVHEEGGGLLIAGFVLSVIGIVWRMLWCRREVAVAWSAAGLVVGGRCEFYPGRFKRELAGLAAHLAAAGEDRRSVG